ncbi:urea transporter [Paraburkholderia ginsengiterrae]|uniref:Urea transporter n=1 Tax=Paraburkholderia ginsengiterrae TaxID=1462993 RepID=A0A1A9MZU7_9BURK|nr:urea transporter [Paraburkholderia ginsengiterrae]OAJ52410.1 urea transporter [Paraburkholderia ginsengiterrae]OAJ52716.1 urea transporter [Paraburkholderia ginsengiterrae]
MSAAATHAQSAALRTLLRSLGQIVLQSNAFTGACLVAAWLLYDPRLACAALMGAVAANVSAVLAGYDEDDTRAGLHGFNGALAGLAAFNFIADNATAAAVAILAATGTAWFLAPWSRWLRARGLGFFSSPCLIVTWCWLPLVKSGNAPASEIGPHALNAAQWGRGVLAGLAQTGFASGALSGLLVLLGIAAASRRHALWALIGAGVASIAHLLLGATASSFDTGLLGFNGALTALALADCGVVMMLGGVAVSVALQALAAYLGWPVMTAPFVIATWSVQWSRQCLTRDAAMSHPVKKRSGTARATTTAVPARRVR